MATYTRADLRNAVLQELGVIDGQGAPSEEDAEIADARCQQELEALYDEGLIDFDLDADEIPARFFVALVRVIAPSLMNVFGVMDRAQSLLQGAIAGSRKLSRLKAHRYIGQPVKSEYF